MRQLLAELTIVERAIPSTEFGNLSTLLRLRTKGEIQLARGNPQSALRTLQEAAAKDAPGGSKEYLGRALFAAATLARNGSNHRNLMLKAKDAYATIAFRPAIIRSDSSKYPPGFYIDQLGSYLRIAIQLQESSEQLRDARIEFDKLTQGNSNNEFHNPDASRVPQ
jgi:hypothetical protein